MLYLVCAAPPTAGTVDCAERTRDVNESTSIVPIQHSGPGRGGRKVITPPALCSFLRPDFLFDGQDPEISLEAPSILCDSPAATPPETSFQSPDCP